MTNAISFMSVAVRSSFPQPKPLDWAR